MSRGTTWGLDMRSVQGQRGGNEPPPGRYLFEIADHRQGVDKNGLPYVMFQAKVVEGDHEGKSIWAFFGTSDERIGWLKGFLEDLGRDDLFDEDRGPADVVGATFEADVRIRRGKDGSDRAQLMNVVGTTAGYGEAPADPEPASEPAPKPQPRKPGRPAGSGR